MCPVVKSASSALFCERMHQQLQSPFVNAIYNANMWEKTSAEAHAVLRMGKYISSDDLDTPQVHRFECTINSSHIDIGTIITTEGKQTV